MPLFFLRAPCKGGAPQRGFTLVELMVTIAVFAILIAIAIPSFSSQIQKNRTEIASDAFYRMVANARVLASQKGMKIGLSVSANKSLNTSTWTDGCGKTAVWAVYQADEADSNKKKALICLSATDFDNRYRTTTIEVTGSDDLTYQPTGVASNETISVKFTQGDKASTVTILPGGTASVASN